ncbi:MAG: acetylxylan esterase [Kiritimatiellae bacterium]|nr:acetylxylan esterase [Kiritimatiellia bacterium]
MKGKILLSTLSLAFAVCAAKIEISQDHADALYRKGEEAVFTVTVKDDAGVPLKEGAASWTLDNFGTKGLGKGTADLSAANPFTVKGTMAEEGFLRLTVNSHKARAVWGVGYNVEDIRQSEPCPADFDAYWNGEKARLEREVPLDPKMTLDEKRSSKTFNCYRVNFATFGGRRVYGFLAVPKDASKAPFRLRVCVPGAGPGVIGASTRPDEIYLVMNVHMFEPEETNEAQKEHMVRQNRELAERFGLPQTWAYCSKAGIAESREDYWYHDVMLGINRAIDWVCTRKDVDLTQVTYTGSSQGGGFGLFLNYLNSHFTKAFVAVCAITGHYGYKQSRQNGWPNLIPSQPEAKKAVAERYAAYFDGVNFAARIRHPIRFIVGFADCTCPPADVYAAYNVCPSSDKVIVNAIGSGHSWYEWHRKDAGKPGHIDFDAWLRTK